MRKKKAKLKPQNYWKWFYNWFLALDIVKLSGEDKKEDIYEELKQEKNEQLQGLDPTLWSCMCHFLPLNMTSPKQYCFREVR